jgi:hypothetical protein
MVDLYGDGRWIYIKNSTSPHGLFKFDLNLIDFSFCVNGNDRLIDSDEIMMQIHV